MSSVGLHDGLVVNIKEIIRFRVDSIHGISGKKNFILAVL